MKKLTLLFLYIFITFMSEAQINWTMDFEVAQDKAIKENKFILMDFWHISCQPCKVMYTDIWSRPEMVEQAKNFVAFRIDTAQNRAVTRKYGATFLPRVVVIDAAENIVWQKGGYNNVPELHTDFINKLPINNIDPDAIHKLVKGEKDGEAWFSVASSYQEMARVMDNKQIQTGFFTISDSYFKKAEKSGKGTDLETSAALGRIVNIAYRGNTKKAMKLVNSYDDNSTEMKNFILAYCYMLDGKKDLCEKHKALVTDKELVAKIE